MRILKLRTWITEHRKGLILTLIFTVIGLSWVIPPHVSYIVIQRILQEVWMTILGVMNIPYSVLVWNDLRFLVLLFTIVLAGFFTVFIRICWIGGWLGRLLLLILLVGNSALGLATRGLGAGDGYVYDTTPRIECERFTSQQDGIRLISYRLSAVDYSFAHYFFLTTDNAGKDWRQIGYTGYDYGLYSCNLRQRYGNTDINYSTCQPEQGAVPPFPGCEYLAGN